MSEETSGREQRGFVGGLRSFPTWKKIVIGASSLVLLAGVGLAGYEQLAGPSARSGEQGVAPRNVGTGERGSLVGRSEFLPGEGAGGSSPPGDATLEGEGGASYSPSLLKGGLSFFVGFCCGYAARAFLKVSAIVAGVVLLAIFGLSYAGWLTVEWSVMETQFNNLFTSLKGQAADFQAFITGSLPSAGMAGLGLFTGVKKN